MLNNLHLTEYCAQTRDIISDSVNVCDAEVTDSNTTCAAVVDLSSTNVYASVVRNVDQHTCYASGCSDEGDRDNNDGNDNKNISDDQEYIDVSGSAHEEGYTYTQQDNPKGQCVQVCANRDLEEHSRNPYGICIGQSNHNNHLRSMTYSKPTYGLSHNKVSCSASIQTASSQSQQMDALTSQVSVPRLTVCQPDNNQVSTPRRDPPGSCVTTNQNGNITPTSPAESDHTDNCSWPKFMQRIGYPHIEPPPEGDDQNNQTTLEINGTLNLTMDSDTYNDPAAADFSKWPFPAKELPHTLANIYDQVKTYGCHNYAGA